AAVLVPEGTGILQARLPDHLDGRIPGAGRLRRRGHENTLGRCYEVDVQAAGVSPDGRCPDTARVAIAQRVVEPGVLGGVGEIQRTGQVIAGIEIEPRERMAD